MKNQYILRSMSENVISKVDIAPLPTKKVKLIFVSFTTEKYRFLSNLTFSVISFGTSIYNIGWNFILTNVT